MIATQQIQKAEKETKNIKCLIWDLDNTLWSGTLLEDSDVKLQKGVVTIMKELDRRGILQSISSKNHYETAKEKLEELGVWDYFLFPQIHWDPKSKAVEQIAADLNFALNTIAFIDDQAFEREEVAFQHPDVLCLDASEIYSLLDLPRMNPKFLTEETGLRRKLYQNENKRKQAQDTFNGNNEAFLKTLQMVFTIRKAEMDDLQRAEELTMRTSQLNTTGYTYSHEELEQFRQSDNHLLYVAKLTDSYGDYGTIGLCLVEKNEDYWKIKLLLMSCRVMSRNVGSVMMHFIMNQAKAAEVTLRAEFVSNNRNRMMYITYKFGGFQEIETRGDLITFEHNLEKVPPYPDYLQLELP